MNSEETFSNKLGSFENGSFGESSCAIGGFEEVNEDKLSIHGPIRIFD